MTATFAGLDAKLDRADEHLAELRELLMAHMSRPDLIVGTVEYRPDDDPAANLHPKLRVQGLPPKVQVVIGDVVHNLRSALDHVAWQLVIANGGTPVPGTGGTQFPIKTLPPRKGPVHVKGGVSAAAHEIICAAQADQEPYRYGNALAVLAHVSNIDKHREPARGRHGVSSWVTWTGSGDLSTPWVSTVVLGEPSLNSVEIRLDPALPDDRGGHANYTVELEMSDDEWGPLYGTLDDVAWQVRRLVGDLVSTMP